MNLADEQRASGHRLAFENCAEFTEPVSLAVTGSMPVWLEGTLFRNGPGVFDIGTSAGRIDIDHWFDGLAVLHRFQLQDSRVQYRNRHIARGLERYIRQSGRTDFRGFAIDPGLNPLQKALALFGDPPRDPETGRAVQNVDVTVGRLGTDRFICKTDANLLQPFDPESLEPGPLARYTDLNAEFEGQLSAAHSQYDLERGEFFNFTLKLGRTGRYTVFCIPDDEPEGHVLARFEAPPAYIHSFALTPRYLVLMVWPALLHPLKVLWQWNIVDGMRWAPEHGTVFHVIDRQRRERVATYRADAFYAFHNVNAFDDGDDVCIDICAYDDASSIDSLRLERLRDDEPQKSGQLRRYRLEEVTGASVEKPRTAHYDLLSDIRCELPRINQATHQRGSRFVYALSNSGRHGLWDRIVRIDLGDGAVCHWSEPGCFPGEPIFVAAPDAEAEDDGVVLSVVLDSESNRSFLLVLDAENLTERGRAGNAPRVPMGFHGNFYGVGLQEQ